MKITKLFTLLFLGLVLVSTAGAQDQDTTTAQLQHLVVLNQFRGDWAGIAHDLDNRTLRVQFSITGELVTVTYFGVGRNALDNAIVVPLVLSADNAAIDFSLQVQGHQFSIHFCGSEGSTLSAPAAHSLPLVFHKYSRKLLHANTFAVSAAAVSLVSCGDGSGACSATDSDTIAHLTAALGTLAAQSGMREAKATRADILITFTAQYNNSPLQPSRITLSVVDAETNDPLWSETRSVVMIDNDAARLITQFLTYKDASEDEAGVTK